MSYDYYYRAEEDGSEEPLIEWFYIGDETFQFEKFQDELVKSELDYGFYRLDENSGLIRSETYFRWNEDKLNKLLKILKKYDVKVSNFDLLRLGEDHDDITLFRYEGGNEVTRLEGRIVFS